MAGERKILTLNNNLWVSYQEKGAIMQEENLSILQLLKQNIEELIPPIETAQKEIHQENKENTRSGLDLIMSDLTMMVVLLTTVDLNVSARERELINDMRHAVYGSGVPELTSDDYVELFREFLHLYPNRRLTLDHMPSSIKLLRIYDRGHGTEYAGKAKRLFIQFAEAIIKADKKKDHGETLLLANFKDILNAA